MAHTQTDEIDQIRRQIMHLAKEIERLSESNKTPPEFFAEFLRRLTEAVGAAGAGVWLMETGTTRPAFEVGLQSCGFPESLIGSPPPDNMIRDSLSTGESAIHDPVNAGSALPTNHLYIISALQVAEQPVGAVVVLKEPNVPPDSRRGLLQFIEQMTGYASRYLTRVVGPKATQAIGPRTGASRAPQSTAPMTQASPARPPGNGATRPPEPAAEGQPATLGDEFLAGLEKFVLQLQRARNVAEVANIAASDSRMLLGVERVALARKRGRKVPIEATSGGQKVNARSNEIRRLSDLCRTVMQGREPLFYTGQVEELPPQLEKPLADYIEISKARLVVLIPLFEANELIRPEHEEQDENNLTRKQARVIGCLVAEQFNASRPPAQLRQRLDVMSDHVAAALQNTVTSERIFLRRPLLAIGKTKEWFHGRKLAKTLAILAGVTAVALALWLVPYPYRVTSEGRLMPVVQRSVFAPWDGEVTQLEVTGGEEVAEGELLAALRNDDLQSEIVKVRNQRDEKLRAVLTYAGQIDEARRKANYDEINRLEGERLAAEAEIAGFKDQLRILQDRQERLKVTSPIAGTVATFQLDQLLRNRPVRRGESLMEVMKADGEWHLEIDVKDPRMGHIREAIADHGSIDLPVEFVLATNPETTYDGTVYWIASRAEPDQEEGNIVRFKATIADPDRLPQRRIGAEVRAKIDCGPMPLGYVLFGDVVEFLRKHLWL